MANTCQQLSVLVDQAPSVMKRLYAARLSLNSLKKKLSEKLFSAAAKKFPGPAEADKLVTIKDSDKDTVLKELGTVVTGIGKFGEWRKSAKEKLNELGRNATNLSLEHHFNLFTAFMDLATAYSRASLFLASLSLSEKRGSVVLCQALCGKTNTTLSTCVETAKELVKGEELTFCEELGECRNLLKNALISLKYSENADALCDAGLIDFTMSDNYDAPTQSKKVFDAYLANRVPDWAGFGVFIVPELLDSPDVKSIEPLFQKRSVFPLYGELYVDIYEELERQTKELKGKKSQVGGAPKKKLHELAGKARAGVVTAHLKRLLHVKQELGVVYHYCKCTPALCAPKLMNILAGLSFAQSEAQCAMYTIAALRADGKNPDAACELEELLPEVMYYATGLEKLLVANKGSVRAYYTAYLAKADRAALQADGVFGESVQKLAQEAGGSLLERLVRGIDAAQAGEQPNLSDARASVLESELALAKASRTEQFSGFLRILHLHFAVAESIEKLLAPLGMEWAWYLHDQLERTFYRHIDAQTSQQRHVNTRSAVGPLYASAYYAVLSHTNRLFDAAAFLDEGKTLCEKTKDALKRFSEKLVDKIFVCAQSLLQQYEEYDRQLTPERIALRVQHKQVEKNFTLPLLPGTESMPAHWDEEQSVAVRTAFMTLDRLCWALREAEVIEVGDYTCDLTKLVRTRFEGFLKEKLDELFKLGDDLSQFVRPSDALRRVRVMHFTLSNIESAVPLDLDTLWRQVLLSSFSPEAASDLSVFSCAKDPCAEYEKTVLGNVLRFYTQVLEKLAAGDAIYSPKRCSFVSRTPGPFKAELYTDFNDLRDLCTLVGPVGVKLLDAAVLRRACTAVERISGILNANKDVLARLAKGRGNDAPASGVQSELRELDEFVRCAIDAGTCLAFRGLLKTAQRSAAEGCAPMLFDALASVYDEYPPNVYQLPELSKMDFLALSLGIESAVTLQDVKTALRDQGVAASPASRAIWDGFPLLLAAAFDSSTFRASQYLPALEGFQTNVHVLYFCLTELLCSIAVVVRGREDEAEADEADDLSESQPPSAVAAQKTFVSAASSFIYRIYQQAIAAPDAKGKKETFVDLYSMFVFMDDFFTHGTFLTRTYLETNLPYALLREAFRKELSTQTSLNSKQASKQTNK